MSLTLRYYAEDMIAGSEFVSYAQNMEDVVLARLVAVVSDGRFIDVGAGHPILENVTYALYLKGWRGINVEPMSAEVELLRAQRPGDETVQAAVGEMTGSITLFEAPSENRGSTTSSAELAGRYATESGQQFAAFDSPMVTLSSLLGKFEPGAVQLVKIDVEGMEYDVLTGAELEKHRPWVVVVEATAPNSPDSTAHLWEDIISKAGYRCTLFDGLNRFYVRSDLPAIAELLSVPANVFDRWIPSTLLAMHSENEHLRAEIEHLRVTAREAETYAHALENVVHDLRVANEKKRGLFGRSRP